MVSKQGVTVIALTFLSLAALIVIIVFTILNVTRSGNVFSNATETFSDKYGLEVTPAGFAFSIWSLIYIWQGAWLLYTIANIFRKNSKGRVIFNPLVLPISFYVFWLGVNICNLSWLFAWDREELLASFFMLLLQTVFGHTAIGFQAVATTRNEEEIRKESKVDLVLIRVLIQNGIDIWVEWATIATFLNLAIVLVYSPQVANKMTSHDASTLALSLLLVLVIVRSALENTILFKFFKFHYVWYPVLFWTGGAILNKNYVPSNRNSILTIVIIVVSGICLGIKIAVYLYRTRKNRTTA